MSVCDCEQVTPIGAHIREHRTEGYSNASNTAIEDDVMEQIPLTQFESRRFSKAPRHSAALERYVKTEILKMKDTAQWLAAFRNRKTLKPKIEQKASYAPVLNLELMDIVGNQSSDKHGQIEFEVLPERASGRSEKGNFSMSQPLISSLPDCFAEVEPESTSVTGENAPIVPSKRCSNIEDPSQPRKRASFSGHHLLIDPTGMQRNGMFEVASSNFNKLRDWRPLVPKRTFPADLNDPTMQRYKMIMNNWLIYERYVAESGQEEAFQRTRNEVGERAAIHLRANYHGLMGGSL